MGGVVRQSQNPIDFVDARRHLRRVAAEREKHVATSKISRSVEALVDAVTQAEDKLRLAAAALEAAIPFIGYDATVPDVVAKAEAAYLQITGREYGR